ncbi:hypothetical protein F5146DRAFT_1006174 [Armillaria mellea]|nr:hypothetical protein F5146DRAFT_1006174 [Armillaria mellea]
MARSKMSSLRTQIHEVYETVSPAEHMSRGTGAPLFLAVPSPSPIRKTSSLILSSLNIDKVALTEHEFGSKSSQSSSFFSPRCESLTYTMRPHIMDEKIIPLLRAGVSSLDLDPLTINTMNDQIQLLDIEAQTRAKELAEIQSVFQHLQQQYDRTVSDLRCKKSLLSPIRWLPADILLHIFSLAADHLLYMEGPCTIITVPLVQDVHYSKSILGLSAISGYLPLLQSLDFTLYKPGLEENLFATLSKLFCSAPLLRTVRISGDVFPELSFPLHQLTRLDLNLERCPNSPSLFNECIARGTDLRSFSFKRDSAPIISTDELNVVSEFLKRSTSRLRFFAVYRPIPFLAFNDIAVKHFTSFTDLVIAVNAETSTEIIQRLAEPSLIPSLRHLSLHICLPIISLFQDDSLHAMAMSRHKYCLKSLALSVLSTRCLRYSGVPITSDWYRHLFNVYKLKEAGLTAMLLVDERNFFGDDDGVDELTTWLKDWGQPERHVKSYDLY